MDLDAFGFVLLVQTDEVLDGVLCFFLFLQQAYPDFSTSRDTGFLEALLVCSRRWLVFGVFCTYLIPPFH